MAVYLEMNIVENRGAGVNTIINAKQLRADLPRIVAAVNKGDRFTVLYRSRPAFDIVPPGDTAMTMRDAAADSLYRASPVGRSASGDVATQHDKVLY